MKPLRFAGYAAIFNRLDKGGDIIRPGAFGALPVGQILPLLWQHDPGTHIGKITHATADYTGRALRPWSPVHPDISITDSDDVKIGWTRRSRSGLKWLDYVETALGEASEEYRVDITPTPYGTAFAQVTTGPALTILSETLEDMRTAGSTGIDVVIRQSGTFTLSPELRVFVPI